VTARQVEHGGGAERAAAFLMLPVAAVMRVVEIPFAWIQKRLGLGGLATAFLAPNMLVFGIFVLVPLGINILYSFTTGAALFLENRTYTGADQYRILFDCKDYLQPLTCRNDAFWRSVHNTTFFVVVEVVALVVVSLITALVLNREMRARGFWRGVFFFPVLLSPVVVALIWKWILQRDGVLNAVLTETFGMNRVLWLAEPGWAMFWAIFVSIWAHMGFFTLILLAGLQAIPRDLYEAAEMDGTKPFRVLRRITLPLLWPNLVVVIILALIRGVQTFDEVYVLTGGGPGSSTQFLTQFIYQTGFANSIRNLGLASAASILMGIVLVVLTAIQLTASNSRERREAR
jgi:alpha-1,4-digalacturonate transport system permease protein